MNTLDIICRAMRRIGVLASGQLPTDAERDDALETLKSLYLGLIASGTFGELADTFASGETYEPAEFTRVLYNDPETTTVTLPDSVTDDCGDLRPPRDCAVIAIANILTNTTVTHIYDGDIGQWIGIETLDITSEVPLAARDANGLASALAIELAPEYGQQPSEIVALSASRWANSVVHNWSRVQVAIPKSENYF